MVTNLLRLTTDYVDTEDRLKMAGETPDGRPVVMWLTGRLAGRAIPQLLRWLDQAQPSTPVAAAAAAASPAAKQALHSFAQEVAVAELKPQTPVTAAPSAPSWLVKAIDFQATTTHLGLIFRGDPGQSASLRVTVQELRQWLAILHLVWSKAEWPPLVWPGWITSAPPPPQDAVRH